MDSSALKLKLPLIKKFLILTSVSFFAVWFLLSSITSLEIQLFTLNRIEDQTKKLIKNYVEIEVPESAFTTDDYHSSLDKFDGFFKQGNVLGIEFIKIYNKEKNIIYSSKKELIGTKASGSDAANVEKTLNGEDPVFENESSSEEASNDKGVKNTFEIHFPIKYTNSSETVGVIEAYVTRAPIYKSLAPFLYTIWITVGLVFGFLFLVLRKIFKNASDTIVNQNIALNERTKVLDRRNKEKESILDSIGEVLVVLNDQNKIILMNKKGYEITGLELQDVIVKPFKDIIKLSGFDAYEAIKKSIKKKETVRITYKEGLIMKTKTKKEVPVSLIVSPIIIKDKVEGTVITLNDAQSERDLDKVKDEFVFVVAHELGNPIFALGGYLDMIARSKLDRNSYGFVKTAQEINRQLSGMVTDLIETARSESGQMNFPLEDVDISSTIKTVIENLSEKAKTKKVSVELINPTLPKVMSNDKKLYEVILNLTDNAIKYSKPEGGKVTISAKETSGQLEVTISDNGLGMSEEEQKNLFEKFYRVKNDKTQGIEGTGLGLFIVKTILEKMNGTITVESKENIGTKFIFSLATVGTEKLKEKKV